MRINRQDAKIAKKQTGRSPQESMKSQPFETPLGDLGVLAVSFHRLTFQVVYYSSAIIPIAFPSNF